MSIFCKCEFAHVIRHCYTPEPVVEWVYETMDFKKLVRALPWHQLAPNACCR